MIVRMQITIQGGTRKEARDGDGAFRIGGYADNSFLQGGLCVGGECEGARTYENERNYEWTHAFST